MKIEINTSDWGRGGVDVASLAQSIKNTEHRRRTMQVLSPPNHNNLSDSWNLDCVKGRGLKLGEGTKV